MLTNVDIANGFVFEEYGDGSESIDSIENYTPGEARKAKEALKKILYSTERVPPLEEVVRIEKCLSVLNEILDRETNLSA